MAHLKLTPRGPFELSTAARFLMSSTPASGTASVGPAPGRLTIAFRLDETFEPIAVSLAQEGSTIVVNATGSSELQRVEQQIERIFSLDQDGASYVSIGARDAVVGRLLATYENLRPVCFGSPYEAGVWGLLAHRGPMRVAAALRRRIAVAHGDVVRFEGHRFALFPSPERLLSLDAIDGVSSDRLSELRALAEAALAGKLDAARLRAMPAAEALPELERIRGVSSWTASHILLRGAGTRDQLGLAEPKVQRAIAHAYGLSDTPTDVEAMRLSQSWRPFRTWVANLLLVHLQREGHQSERTRPRALRSKLPKAPSPL